jgi:hypothetical protein
MTGFDGRRFRAEAIDAAVVAAGVPTISRLSIHAQGRKSRRLRDETSAKGTSQRV